MLPTITGHPKTQHHSVKGYSTRQLPCINPTCTENTEPHSHDYLGGQGSGYLERKANGDIVYHTPWLTAAKRKPFSMPPLKARVDKDSSKAFERIQGRVEKTAGTQSYTKGQPAKGRTCTKGWELVTTDGERALIIPGDGTGEPMASIGDIKGYQRTTIADPEFQLAVKRAAVMAHPRTNTVMLTCKAGTLTLESQDPDCGSFDETLSVVGKSSAWRVALNVDFIEPLLGTWPLTVWVKDKDSAVVFEPQDKSWRYVVMPMRADWPKEAVEQVEATV